MENSRVQKYKDYRSSMIKDGSAVIEEEPIKSEETDHNRNTTSTLPMDQVIDSLKSEEINASFERKEKVKRIILTTLIIAGLLILTAAIIVIGIIIWR